MPNLEPNNAPDEQLRTWGDAANQLWKDHSGSLLLSLLFFVLPLGLLSRRQIAVIEFVAVPFLSIAPLLGIASKLHYSVDLPRSEFPWHRGFARIERILRSPNYKQLLILFFLC
jgi:hypothetical protein